MALTRPRAAQIYDIDYKQATRVITVTNITLSGGAPSLVDGVTLSLKDRVLVTGQTSKAQNGIYYVTTLGSGSNGTWSRSLDTDATGELLAGTIVMVTEGTVYHDTQWKLTTNDPIVIGVSELIFEQNSAFAFGNVYANGTAVLATSVGDVLTLTAGNNIQITGNNTAKSVTIGVTGISLTSIANGTSNVNVTGSGSNVSVGVGGTDNVAVFATTGEYVTGLISATGNIVGGNISTTGNVTGNYQLGNGSQLTGINAFSNIAVTGGSYIAANTIGTLLTLVAGNSITLTANNTSKSLQIDYSAAGGSSIFATGGDMGTVVEAVSSSEDLGNVTSSTTTSYDLGQLGVQGVVSNSDIVNYQITGNKFANNITISTTGNVTGANIAFTSSTTDVRGWWFGSGNAVSVNSQETAPTDVILNTAGTAGSIMYVVGTGNKTVYQYSLSTPYKASTASYASVSANVAAQDSSPQGIRFNTTNTVLYMLGATNKTIYQYNVTYSNIATLSYASLSFSVNSQEASPRGFAFGNAMTNLYVVGTANAAIYQYGLTSAGNIATAVYTAPGSFSVSSQDSTPTGIEFSSDGYTCYVVGSQNDYVYQYTLSTAWDVTTASYSGYKFSVYAQEGAATGLYRTEDGAMAYVTGAESGTARVWQYNIGLGTIATSNSLYLGGTIQAIGNIQTQGYLFGNGALLYGVSATTIANTTSNITAGTAGGNITVGIGGTANVATFSANGITATNFYGNGAALTGVITPALNINLQQNYGGF